MPYSSQWRRLGEAGFLILIRGDGEQQPKVMTREDMQRVPVVVEARHAGDRVNADHLDAIQSKSLSLQTNLSALLRSGFVSPLSIRFATASHVHPLSPPPRISRQASTHPSGSRSGPSRSSSQPRSPPSTTFSSRTKLCPRFWCTASKCSRNAAALARRCVEPVNDGVGPARWHVCARRHPDVLLCTHADSKSKGMRPARGNLSGGGDSDSDGDDEQLYSGTATTSALNLLNCNHKHR
jgi:hypothetical protein